MGALKKEEKKKKKPQKHRGHREGATESVEQPPFSV